MNLCTATPREQTQLEAMHELIEKIHFGNVDHANADILHRYIDILHRYIDTQDAVIKSKERQIEDLVVRAQILQQDTKKYKEKAGELQLVAGRYQYQFEHAMKVVNKMDDVFEYAYANMTPDQLRVIVRTALADFTDAVKPKGE